MDMPGSWAPGGPEVREEGPRREGPAGKGLRTRGPARTHLLVAAILEIVLSGRHAQGGLVYLETEGVNLGQVPGSLSPPLRTQKTPWCGRPAHCVTGTGPTGRDGRVGGGVPAPAALFLPDWVTFAMGLSLAF